MQFQRSLPRVSRVDAGGGTEIEGMSAEVEAEEARRRGERGREGRTGLLSLGPDGRATDATRDLRPIEQVTFTICCSLLASCHPRSPLFLALT